MSNIIAGDIFEKIIEEVVQSSQTDFEENGVPQQTLTELKQTWQQKLSVRNVAQMPWDPKPAPPPQAQPAQQSTNNQSYAPPPQAQAPNGARVKNEPGAENYNGNAYMPQAMNPELAQQRAASLLQQQYGSQASASLGAMRQGGIALPGQQQQQQHQQHQQQLQHHQQQKPTGLQLPPQNPQSLQQQYQQQLKQQQAAQQQPRIKTETDGASDDFQANKRPRFAYGQTDGAGDGMEEWKAMLASARSVSDEERAQNDALMRDHVAQMARELESGLMQPLDGRKQEGKKESGNSCAQPLAAIPQLDGDFSDDEKADVKDEEDENAINSDLDDSGDEANNADEDDDDIDSMLCTYDKVQRVKNKWKCTLKDGVLSANGKEYLFHKAQGEFEW
ncbi:putative transcription factor IIA, alpha/beta subunit [Elsinoe australis]|uniref:Putative transcription factor IIA, alpha/beta subunit n=1 Tax=Elsinoe australis TaxID=40998 RepID=A0A4U7ANC5_9PEZI|nr:putative transcription factor IIA, alpha/beta subunit [Elsinoe australis]